MASIRFDRWVPGLIIVVGGSVLAVMSFLDGSRVSAVVFLSAFAVLGWWSWPGRRGPHVSHERAWADAGDGDVIVYWRPG